MMSDVISKIPLKSSLKQRSYGIFQNMSYKNASAQITPNSMATKGKINALNSDFIVDIELNVLGEKSNFSIYCCNGKANDGI